MRGFGIIVGVSTMERPGSGPGEAGSDDVQQTARGRRARRRGYATLTILGVVLLAGCGFLVVAALVPGVGDALGMGSRRTVGAKIVLSLFLLIFGFPCAVRGFGELGNWRRGAPPWRSHLVTSEATVVDLPDAPNVVRVARSDGEVREVLVSPFRRRRLRAGQRVRVRHERDVVGTAWLVPRFNPVGRLSDSLVTVFHVGYVLALAFGGLAMIVLTLGIWFYPTPG